MIPQLQKPMTTLPKGLTTAILAFLMLAAAITAAIASGTPQPLNASLPENSPAGTSLGTPMETTAPAGTVSYSLSGTDAGLFNIDPTTGEITLAQNASPDFETRASYSEDICGRTEGIRSAIVAAVPGVDSCSSEGPGTTQRTLRMCHQSSSWCPDKAAQSGRPFVVVYFLRRADRG